MNITTLLDMILSQHRSDSTLLVGIDGLGGAGKSTISETLCTELQNADIPATLLHIDHFIHPRAVRYNTNYPEWECYYHLQWRYDDLLERILRPLQKNGTLDTLIELYDLDNDSYTQFTLNVPVGSVVIVEGIFLQRRELADVFDIMAYVDVPEDVRLQRVLDRDGYIGDRAAIAAKYERRYFPAERYYVKNHNPAETADILIR